MNYPKVCVPRLLTPEQKQQANELAVKENPLNRAWGAGPKKLALEVGKRWANGKLLRVYFLNGTPTQKAKCEREAHKWEQYANLKFLFNNDPNAEIRVGFKWDNDPGSWSYVGTDAATIPKNQPTLNLGWLEDSTDDQEWERVVVHEFGHAIGADHEDQQPAEKIKWNREAVYKYFTGPPNNWSREMVDSNILNPTGEAGVAHTDFDPNSIMAYSIPAEFTTDGVGVPGGNTLSPLDKYFIGQMYPFPTVPVVTVPTLVPGGPALSGALDSGHQVNTYSLAANSAGNYRVWTSLVSSVVSVFHANNQNVPAARGKQQVVSHLPTGNHTVTVVSSRPGIQATYNISARRIS